MKIAPSLMCMDLLKFKEQIEFIDQHADYFHIDIMRRSFCTKPDPVAFFRQPGQKAGQQTAGLPSDGHPPAGLY